MIIKEEMMINNRKFIRTYSDEGRYVVRDGVSYEDAVDPADKNREYTEGDYIPNRPISQDVDDDVELSDEQAAIVIMGGSL